jgi:hypothetical protein
MLQRRRCPLALWGSAWWTGAARPLPRSIMTKEGVLRPECAAAGIT